MKRSISRNIPFVMGCALLLALTGCDQGADLGLRADPGTGRRLVITENHTISLDIFGMKLEAQQNSDSTIRYTVNSVDREGRYVMSGSYEALREDTSGHIVGTDILAEMMEELKAFEPDYDAAIGQTFTFELHSDGNVRNMRGNTDIIRAMVADIDGIRARTLIEMRQSLDDAMGDEAMARRTEMYLLCNPGKRVKEGATWARHLHNIADLPISATITYTLRERNQGIAHVDYTYHISGRLRDTGLFFPVGHGYEMNVNGRGSGKLEVEEHTGWVRTGHENVTITMDAQISAEGLSLTLPIGLESRMRFHSDPV